MRFLEFGKENDKTIVMFHASCMTWDFLEKSIEILAKSYHLIVPVMPGYDMEDDSDYTSVEEIAKETESYVIKQFGGQVDMVYGISMGGSIVIKMLANRSVSFQHAIIDGGITPVKLPAFLSKLIVWRDFSFMMMLKNSLKFFSLFVSEEKYGKGTIGRLRNVMLHTSNKTLWNNFKSCNTYSMPKSCNPVDTQIQYWYGTKEKPNRRRDIKYIKKLFPQTRIEEIKGFNHAEFVMLDPEQFAEKIKNII